MDLEGNLSKLVVKKSIPVPLRGRRDQNQAKNQEAMQEQHFHRLQIKRIKTQDPLSLYRIRDDCALQISTEEVISPFYMVNICSQIIKVSIDKASENAGLTYYLVPKFDSSQKLGWEFTLNRLKVGGDPNFKELARAFQVLIQTREEFKKTLTNPSTRLAQGLPEFTKFIFSEKYPQIAEVRFTKYESFSDDSVARIGINKKMLSLVVTDSESDAFTSLHLGMKDIFRFMGQEEWIRYLTKCFEAYREILYAGLKDEYDESYIDRIRLSFPSGKSFEADVRSRCRCYSNATVFYYTFYPVNVESFEEIQIGFDQQLTAIEQERQEESEFLKEKKCQAMDFVAKMYSGGKMGELVTESVAELLGNKPSSTK